MLDRPHSLSHGTTNRPAALRKARDARYKARRDACRAVARVEFDGSILDFLIKTHWLAERDAADARAVGEAISMLAASSRI